MDTSQVILHGVVNYALTKLSGYISKPTLSLLDEYIRNIDQPDAIRRKVPFRLADLEEALSICLESSPFFNQNSLKVERHFEAAFLVGNRGNVLNDLLAILAYTGSVQKNGIIKLHFHYAEKRHELHVTVKGSALNRDQLEHICEALSGEGLTLNEVHELAVSFPCSAIGYQPNVKFEKKTPSRDRFPYLHEIAGDTPGMVQEILQTIVDVMPEELDHMKAALNAKDFTRVREVAHKVKSNFRSIEYEEVALVLEQIEAAARAEDLPLLYQLTDRFVTQAESVLEELRTYVD